MSVYFWKWWLKPIVQTVIFLARKINQIHTPMIRNKEMQLGKLPNASQYERPPLRTYFRVVVAEINRQSNAVARV